MKSVIDKILRFLSVLLLLSMCLITIWQVFTRFILNDPSSWSEEVSRYLLVWLSFLCGAMGIKYGSHMGLVLVVDRIKNIRVKMAVHFFAYGICVVVGYIFIRYGYVFMLAGFKRNMLCFNVPMGYIYSIVPISGLIVVINSLELMIKDIPLIFGKMPSEPAQDIEEKGA